MTDELQAYLAFPLVRGVITGIASAAAIDLVAFRSWKNWQEAAAYDWSVAAWRWFQGAVIGGLTGLGLGAVS